MLPPRAAFGCGLSPKRAGSKVGVGSIGCVQEHLATLCPARGVPGGGRLGMATGGEMRVLATSPASASTGHLCVWPGGESGN